MGDGLSLEEFYRPLIQRSCDFPADGKVALVTTFREALEIVRSPRFAARHGLNDVMVTVAPDGKVSIVDGKLGPETAHGRGPDAGARPFFLFIRGEGLTQLHGARHMQRRRALNPLVARDAHAWFGKEVLAPAIERNLATVLRTADGGLPRFDLVPFARRLFVEVAASLIGYDGADNPEGAERLVALHVLINDGQRLVQMMPRDERLEEFMSEMIRGRKELFERFHNPSLERRRRLVEAHARSELSDSDLPHDFLILVARGTPEFSDRETALTTAVTLMAGMIGTNAETLTACFVESSVWFEQHPDDWYLRTDPTFLEGALNETLRLQALNFALPRVALEDLTLTSGRTIVAGEYVALLEREIGRDPTVFGADANAWNPRRTVPADAYPFGFGFSSGAHMCIGMPLVLGQGGLSGMQVPTLAALFANGARCDPDRPATKAAELQPLHDRYGSCPVVLTEPDPDYRPSYDHP